MNITKTLNYPGVLRAFNKIEEASEIEDKTEILHALSKLIDRVIQKDLEQVRHQHRMVSKSIKVTEHEIQELLAKLKESDIVLYDSVSNEQALITSKHYRITSSKINYVRLKGRVNSPKEKR